MIINSHSDTQLSLSLFESLKEKSIPIMLLAWAEGQSYDNLKWIEVLETSI